MNKKFIKKMIMAERLRYEAIKEILPDNLRKRVDTFERDATNFLKEIAIEIIEDDMGTKSDDIKKETKKVKVDFS
jgi:hypothetical protein